MTDSERGMNSNARSEIDDEVDLRALCAIIWRGKWLILLVTFVCAVAGVTYAKLQPDIYTSSALLAPKDGGAGKTGGALRGLASLAGVNVGGEDSNKSVIAQEIIKSRAFLSSFIERHGYEPELSAVVGWKRGSGEFEYNTERYNPETGEWVAGEGGSSRGPSMWNLVNQFRANLSTSTAQQTGMYQVAFKHYSPEFAQEVVSNLVRDLNDHMRKLDIEEAERSIAYLQQKIKETSIAGMQQVFFQLIETETRKVMLAHSSPEYVFRIIDPAVAPEARSQPKRALIAAVATMAGALFGILIVLVRSFLSKGQRETDNPPTLKQE
jgi:uncharacterized protein involved in exopolysaccharide biosynthesis